MGPKVQQFLLCFKNNAFRFKCFPEKHVSKLLQSAKCVGVSVIDSPSSCYAAVSLPLYSTIFTEIRFKCKTYDVAMALDLIYLLQSKGK